MYHSIETIQEGKTLTLTINRIPQKNSINHLLLIEMHKALLVAEQDPLCQFVILQGKEGYFCTGMDFEEFTKNLAEPNDVFSEQYMSLLKQIANSSKVIISLLDGQVLAGGMGIVAASDWVFSTHKSQFALPEALWGLLPACVTPFLIRRIGFQKAYQMTLSTETLSAEKAHHIGLIDELSDNPVSALNRLLLRLSRVTEETIKDLKNYFRKMWILNEAMEKTAVTELTRLSCKVSVQKNIKNFVEKKIFPWERADNDV